MLMRNREFTVDTRVWDGTKDEDLVTWLGWHFIAWTHMDVDDPRLAVQGKEGKTVLVKPEDMIALWPGQSLTVQSPGAAKLLFEPVPKQ